MKTDTKLVNFNEYCPNCKNWDCLAGEDPCNECLTTPARIHSHKPINYEEKLK